MNPFLNSPSDRLKIWREFKKEQLTDSMTDIEQLQSVVNWWAQCPIENRVLDPYDSTSWPTAWELMHYGSFCKSAIGLGMEQTLLQRDGRWNENRVQLLLIDDREYQFLVPCIDDTYILNYNLNEVTKLEDIDLNVILKYQFDFESKKHNEV